MCPVTWQCHSRCVKKSFRFRSSAINVFFVVKCSRTLDNSICYNYENLTFLCVAFNFLYLRVFWLHDARGLKVRGQLEWVLFWFPFYEESRNLKQTGNILSWYCWKYVVYMYLYKSSKLVKIENNRNFQNLRYRSWILRQKFTDLKLKVIINLEISSFLSFVYLIITSFEYITFVSYICICICIPIFAF